MFVLDHVSIVVRDLSRARLFYDAIMSAIGVEKVYDTENALGYGQRSTAQDDAHTYLSIFQSSTASTDNRHCCFRARSEEQVRRFYKAGVAAGGTSENEPKLWPEYHPGYFAAFLKDPEGNRIEVVYHRANIKA